MQGQRLPPAHHVARHCRKDDLSWNGTTPDGLVGDAFEPDPDGVSVTWLEFFGGQDRAANLVHVRATIKTILNIRSKNRLAIVNVGAVERAAVAGVIAGLTVIEDPYADPPPGNPAHALIKEPAMLNDSKLREALASLVNIADIEQY